LNVFITAPHFLLLSQNKTHELEWGCRRQQVDSFPVQVSHNWHEACLKQEVANHLSQEGPMQNYEEIFQASFARTLGDFCFNDEFIARFYRVFMAKSPRIAAMFTDTNMGAQRTMLHDSLLYMVEFSHNKLISEEIRHLARVHGKSGLDIDPALYDVWLDALVEAASSMDPAFSEEVELSWRLVLTPGITCIRFLAARS
jgi:hemoglobin-like flavoprotein